MKKCGKILIIIVAVLFLLDIILLFVGSPIAKNYVEKHDEEWTGRNVEIGRLRVSLLNCSVTVKDFHFKEVDSVADFVSFNKLYVAANPFKLLKKEIYIRKIKLDNPDVNLIHYDSAFNFSNIGASQSADSLTPCPPDTLLPAEKNKKPWAFGLNNIILHNGNIHYNDIPQQTHWSLLDFNINIPGIYLGGRNTDVGIGFKLPEGGNFNTDIKYNIATNMFNATLCLDSINLNNALPFVKDFIDINTADGFLSADLKAVGNLNSPLNTNVSGNITIENVSVSKNKKSDLAGIDSLRIDIAYTDFEQNMYGIDNFYLNNLFFNYIVYDSLSNNISEAMVSKDNEEKLTDEADTVAAIPLSLSIKKLLVENSAITYNDESLKDPFSFCISDLKIAADNFNSETTGALTLDALAGNGGNLHAKWDGSLNDNSNQYLMVSLKNIALKDLSPYSCSLFGYPISSGTLSFIDESTIRDNIIESTNNLDIFNLRVDEARKDIKPQIKNIPFKTALYLVRDVNNHIKLDVPVKGDLSSPKFSYKKALIKTLSNVLLKITISPFAIIANSMGMGDLNLEEMDIIFSDDQLNPEHTEVLTALATILKDQPNLTLTLENKINLNKDTKTLALNILKEDYYLACNPTKTAKTLSTLDIKNINAIKDSDKQFVAFANSLCSEKKKVKIDEQAVFIYNADSLEVRLLNIAAARNSNINKFLIESQSVPSERFLIKEINIEDLRNYKGKDKIITGTEEISAPVTDISAENDSIVPLI